MAVAWAEADCPEAVRWYVAALGEATPDEGSFTRAAECFRLGEDALKLMLTQRREVFGGFAPRDVELGRDGLFVLTGADAKGRPCTARIRVDQDRPYAIRSHAIFVTPAPGYTIREGMPADFAACADVESRTPIVSAEGSYLLSRGEDLRTYIELQDARLWVIGYKSQIVGWTAAALRTLQSRQLTLGYAAQAFLLPEHRASKAFMPASAYLNAWLQENADAMFYFMNVGNESSANFNRGREYWNAAVCDFQIPARSGTRRDWKRVEHPHLGRAADLINAAHAAETLFDPYSADTLVERFLRSPHAYDAERLLLSANAVVGLARGREHIAHTTQAGVTTHSIVASVLDYGFNAEGAAEFRELIEAAAALAHAEGCTHLSILSTPNAPAHDILAPMADNVDHYLMGCSRPSPAGVETTGLYADHLLLSRAQPCRETRRPLAFAPTLQAKGLSPMSPKPFVVAPKDYGRPLNIVGEHVTVLASGARTGGYEVFLQQGPEGSGPPPHNHPWDESFYVVKGEVEFGIADEAMIAKPGTLVHLPAGTTHWFRFAKGGAEMISMTSREGASHMFTDFDREIAPASPDLAKLAELGARYGLKVAT